MAFPNGAAIEEIDELIFTFVDALGVQSIARCAPLLVMSVTQATRLYRPMGPAPRRRAARL